MEGIGSNPGPAQTSASRHGAGEFQQPLALRLANQRLVRVQQERCVIER